MKNINEQKEVIEKIYFLLRDEGFSNQIKILKELLYFIEEKEYKNYKMTLNSHKIFGGSGSIYDISIQDIKKQEKLDSLMTKLKFYKRKNNKWFRWLW